VAITQALKSRFGATDVLLTDSGTSALILAIRALVPPGGTIAFPGYGCVDLTSAAVGASVKVRLYDLDPATLSPDIESVRRVIARGVDAIVVAHLHGYPADIAAVQGLAAAHGIEVIEDAAQGAGGTLNGANLGSIGNVSVLSFGRGKGLTGGSGGALLVRTPKLEARMRDARAALAAPSRGGKEIVVLAAQWLFARPLLYRLPAAVPLLKLGEMVYKSPRPPRAMCRTAAAILREALQADDQEVGARYDVASGLLSLINGRSRFRPVRAIPGGKPGFLRLALVDDSGRCAPRPTLGFMPGYPLTLEQH
jgi:dTDP-4-amino-4,6-dideoxygalactose transaminase